MSSLPTDLDACVRQYDRILFGDHPAVERSALGTHRLLRTPIAHPLYNCVFSLARTVTLAPDEIAQAATRFAGRPFSWWVHEDHEASVGAALLQAGYRRLIAVQAIAHTGPLPVAALPSGFRFEEVGKEASTDDLIAPLSAAYGASVEALRFKIETTTSKQKAWIVRDLSNGVAAAGGTLTAFAERPQIFCLAGSVTQAPYRKRGLYRALSAYRLARAAEQGAQATLIFGDAATSVPICRRLGFHLDAGRVTLYQPA